MEAADGVRDGPGDSIPGTAPAAASDSTDSTVSAATVSAGPVSAGPVSAAPGSRPRWLPTVQWQTTLQWLRTLQWRPRELITVDAARLLARGLAAATVSGLAGLFVWTVLPAIIGWQPSVVLTGSMMPQIRPGDIVVTAPIEGAQVQKGNVIRFADQAVPGRFVMHRVIEVGEDDTLTTRGDANPSPDSTPVKFANIKGIARLRVPFIGLPVVWLRERRYVPLTVAGVTLCLVTVVLTGRGEAEPPRRPVGAHRADRSRSTARR